MINKFGFELETNSFDKRDFISSPLRNDERPEGISEIIDIIANLNLKAESKSWEYTHHNKYWVCKPDSSCGMEICSPVFEFPNFEESVKVLSELKKCEKIKIDERCSFHVHLDVSELISGNVFTSVPLASVLSWWIKIEHIFIDFALTNRKVNQYCRCIGMTDLFKPDEPISPFRIIDKLSDKYLTVNTFHLVAQRRNTIEFRLAESTLDLEFIVNWISLLIHFVNEAIGKKTPENLSWLDFNESIDFLNLEKVPNLKKWFFERLSQNIGKSDSCWWSEKTRKNHIFESLQMDK